MASTTTGERRWASAKRGGMTVLGKVAVPKPINLPSQRLENHGLDPNVEIVPKGSLSWGARPSSSGPSAWGTSSVLSPGTEGASASPPSHLSGRPSSGGGTRPSTAGSERAPDSSSNVWTPNSRPSSASGVLASNNSSLMALRPHSAETRPGSSHLSRFAEPLAEGTAAWGASGSADKLGMAAPAKDGFSLSSGDFPTLGSERDSGKNMECIDQNSHGRPGSSSCETSSTTEKMDTTLGDVKSASVNSWKNDGPQHAADIPHPGIERWHGDPHSFPNPNIPPHPYETWQGGPPVNSPAGVWFRGPPGAPYGAPPMVAPGGFPMDPFPYYRPQVPAPGLLNSQAVPPHSGPHSKNGDLCRPIMEPFMRPGMPIRPGFYPGYYGPPMGLCNPNERDPPFMGVPTGPPVYNRYPNQNAPEPTNSNARSCDGRALEQVDLGPPRDSRRYYSVPEQQFMGWDKNVEQDKSHPCDKGHAVRSSSQENFWSEDQDRRKDEQINHGKTSLHSEKASPVLLDNKIGSIKPSSVKFHKNNSSGESTVNPVVENDDLPRGHTLIQKIEGLNVKARVSDKTQDICREERDPYSRGQLVNSKAIHPTNKANSGVHLERHYPSGILVPVSRDMTVLAHDKGFGSTVRSVTAISRDFSHHLQGRGDQGGRGRFKSQKSSTSESPGRVAAVISEGTTNIQGQEQQLMIQSRVTSVSGVEVKDETTLSASDSSDSQRSKMREIAKQRAIQLQQEEEERIREQKAKALAKLEELNRRSANQGKETSSHKMESIPSHSDDLQKQEESKIKIELHFGSYRSGEEVSTSCGYIPLKASRFSEPDKPPGVILPETNQHLHQDDTVLSQKESLPATDDAHINDVADPQNVQVFEIPNQKRAGYKQKNIHPAKNMSEKPVLDAKDCSASSTIVTVFKEVDGKNVSSFSESKLPVDSPIITDSLVHPKRKNNRAGKIKHKVDEPSAVVSASVQKESDASTSVNESLKLKTVEAKLEPLQPPAVSKDAGQPLGIHPSLPPDDAPHRGINSGKPQHARKLPRNSQGRLVEKSHNNDAVVWAPVRSHNKIEVIDDVDQKVEESDIPSTRTDNSVSSSSKSKRAEMERYVPKAAMRESAQQGTIQLSSTEQSIPDGMNSSKGQASSQIVERAGRPLESRVEGKAKQIQTHGSTESNFVKVSGDKSSSMMNPTKNSQASDVQHETQKPKELPKGSIAKHVAQPVKVQPSKQDEWPLKQHPPPDEVNEENFEDGWNIIEEPVSSVIFTGVKDHGTSGRGKRNPFKGHKGSGTHQNFGSKYHKGAEDDAHYYPETTQADRPTSSKGKNAAQWQPKPQTLVANQLGDGANGRQSLSSEGDKIFKRDASGSGSSELKQHNNQEDTTKSAGLPQISSVPESKDVSRMPNIEVKSAPVHTDGTNNEQRPSSSGHRKNGNYNNRYSRGHEFHGDESFIAQENRQNYAPANRDKPRQNSRYEYQPVRPDSTNRRGHNSEGQTENQHAVPRFRDQHQGTHTRRGGGSFYGRQRGNYQTDAGYE